MRCVLTTQLQTLVPSLHTGMEMLRYLVILAAWLVVGVACTATTTNARHRQPVTAIELVVASSVGEGVAVEVTLERDGSVVYQHSADDGGGDEHFTRCSFRSSDPLISKLFERVHASRLSPAEPAGVWLEERGVSIKYELAARTDTKSLTPASARLRQLVPLIDRVVAAMGREALAPGHGCKRWIVKPLDE